MFNLRKMKFQTKLVGGTIAVVVLILAVIVGVSNVEVRGSLETLGQTSMHSIANSVHAMMEMQDALLLDKVKADLKVMDNEIFARGFPRLSKRQTVSMEITDQVSKQKETVDIPTLEIGGQLITNNFDMVDDVQSKVGGTATIFQLLPGKLLRISTNVKKLDGTRAVGTYIPESSPVYQAIMAGKTYYGIAFVVNDWYLTAYSPLRDLRSEIIGGIYVGRRILSPEFRKALSANHIGGKGYGFIFNDKGSLVFHPEKEGQSLTAEPYWDQFKNLKDGIASYDVDGEQEHVYIRHFEPWGWSYGFAMLGSDMAHGIDRKLFISSAIVACVALVVAGLFIMFVVRGTSKSLVCLAEFTGEVSGGNYDACVDYEADDVIGNTIRAVESMTAELKNKLGFSQGLLNGMTIPCVVTDCDERLTYVNQHELDFLDKDGAPEDYLGQTLGQFFYGDASRNTVVGESIRSGQPRIGMEVKGRTTKGRPYVALIDSAPLRDLDGQIIGGFCLLTDITSVRENEETIRAQRDQVLEVARRAEAISQQLAAASDDLSSRVEESSRGAGVQLQRTEETSTAMEEMNATVMEVARHATEAAKNADGTKAKAQEGAQLVERVVSSIHGIGTHSEGLKASMAELGGQAEAIGQVMNVITDIADQTNLLALNAAIEAARAGDAGRGFAVVADEVRKLAEKTMDATKEVGSAIQNIQAGARTNVTATETAVQAVQESTSLAGDSGRALNEIVNMVERTADQVRNIATAAEQQSATSEEINRATDEINTISQQTAERMNEAQEAIVELKRLAEQLDELIRRMQN